MKSVTNSATPAGIRAKQYPSIGRSTYMNAASAGPIPARAQRAVEALDRMRIEVDRCDVERLADVRRRTRTAAAAPIGAESDEIALGPNTSWGIGLATGFVARRDGPIEGDRVVLSEGEFPANVYPWLALEREGVTVDRVPADEYGRPREDALLERLDTAAGAVPLDVRRDGVVCVRREGAIRFSPHVYNTVAEMERAVRALEEVVDR
ncbi:MAG: aminotransferase class V-fold PLP-dependent enzyme [Gemmatimonadota bacterium]